MRDARAYLPADDHVLVFWPEEDSECHSTLKHRWFLPPNRWPTLQSVHWQERAQGCDYGDWYVSIQQNQRGIHIYILCVASSVQLTGTEATSLVNTYVFDTVYANPALTGPKKVMEELEQNFLDGFLEVPDFASREPSPVPSLTPRTSQEACSTGKCGHKRRKGSRTAEEKEENQ